MTPAGGASGRSKQRAAERAALFSHELAEHFQCVRQSVSFG